MIEFKNVCFSYGKHQVFSNLSFTVDDFNSLAILGLNGEGKTTLLKLMLGLLKPDKGEITIDGNTINKLSDLKRSQLLSYVPQESDNSLTMTVSDFICMSGINRQDFFKGPDVKDREKALKIMKELSSEIFIDRPVNALSVGQRQLIYLARAIFQSSNIMLMDEPVSSLDLVKQHEFLTWLKEYSDKENKRLIMSLHDPSLAYDYCDTFLIFKDHELLNIINKADSNYQSLLCENLEILYDHKVKVRINENTLSVTYLR